MNKSESKYFHTAVRMDEAFLALLDEKDFAYITVKEICKRAGVSRSTFYLHYETISDLLSESMEYVNEQFLSYMKLDTEAIVSQIRTCPLHELFLVTPQYLTPYLNYILEHKNLFHTVVQNANALCLHQTYTRMFRHVFQPILERFHVPAQDQSYIMTFYLSGLMAILAEWIAHDCTDSISHVITIIQTCIPKGESTSCTQEYIAENNP